MPLEESPDIAGRSERGLTGLWEVTTIAIAIAAGPKPNDGHSTASDLATSASAGAHRRAAVDAPRVAATLADGLGAVVRAPGELVAHRRQRKER